MYYPLLLSYPGELKQFFQSCIDNRIQKYLCEQSLAKYKSYHTDIDGVFEINELKAPNENLSVYWKYFEKSMQKAHEEASKSSFIQMLARLAIRDPLYSTLFGTSTNMTQDCDIVLAGNIRLFCSQVIDIDNFVR